MEESRRQALDARPRRGLVAGAVGNLLEWYDFALFGLTAPILSRQFFPHEDSTASLLQAFAAFAVGYLMRPLGGLAFGWIGDRIGRKRALELSVWLMSVPTVLMGLLPGYREIGLAAPIALVLLRVVQGFSVGGEWVGSMVFLVEGAAPKKRGGASSWGLLTISVGLLLGSAVALVMSAALGADRYHAWGWRVPYISGAVLAVFAIWARGRMVESPLFEELAASAALEEKPVRSALNEAWRPILRMMAAVAISTVSFTAFFVWVPTHVVVTRNLSQHDAMMSNTVGLVVLAALTPVGGVLSDRVGYARLYRVIVFALGLAVVPLMALIGLGDLARVLLGQVGFGVLLAFLQPSVVFASMFPTRVRATAMGIGYNVPQAILGGLTPLTCTWLAHRTSSEFTPGLFIFAVAVLSFVAALGIKTRREP